MDVWSERLTSDRFTKADAERFWSKVGPRRDGACWRWLGRTTNGYGNFRIKYTQVPAHRAAFAMLRGYIAPNRHVHHNCGNRWCVNPEHMAVLTEAEHAQRRGKAGKERIELMMERRRKRYERLVKEGRVRPLTH